MPKGTPRNLPTGITPKMRRNGDKREQVVTKDGTPVYRVRVWDPVLQKQVERTAAGLDARKRCWNSSTRRSGVLGDFRPSVSGSSTWLLVTWWRTR